MKKIVASLLDLRNARLSLDGTVGFVPTMGSLHDGHLTLVARAKAENEHVVVSIFVNPTQFGANEDFSKYPRDLERDFNLLRPLDVSVVWTPSAEEIYPHGYQTWVEVEALTQPLEGAMRPSHFRGVTTVVAKLFNAVQPTKAYFGQKDAQQAAVIRRMVADLNFPLEVVVCPTAREADGLALSSRNQYLSAEERKGATVLFRSLNAAKALYENGERDAEKLRQKMKEILASEPLAQPQYVSCADYDSLQELDFVQGKALLSLAIYFGETRLIDNLILSDERKL